MTVDLKIYGKQCKFSAFFFKYFFVVTAVGYSKLSAWSPPSPKFKPDADHRPVLGWFSLFALGLSPGLVFFQQTLMRLGLYYLNRLGPGQARTGLLLKLHFKRYFSKRYVTIVTSSNILWNSLIIFFRCF